MDKNKGRKELLTAGKKRVRLHLTDTRLMVWRGVFHSESWRRMPSHLGL